MKYNKSEQNNLKLTSLEKICWNEEGITKGDLIKYYKQISSYLLPYVKDRPQTLLRYPNGINGEGFYQKDISQNVPEWIKTIEILSESTGKKVNYFVIKDLDSLLYLVNLGCIEINPWFSRIDHLENPDYLVLDLDPESISFDHVIQTALVIKDIFDEIRAKCFCKTSGATGLHIYVPLNARYDFDMARQFAHLVAKIVNKRLPEITSLERNPEKRIGKVYIDYLQNSIGHTVAAPYSVRPRPGATVSTPLEWEEVKPGLDPGVFNIDTIPGRVEKTGDLFNEILNSEINIIKCINNLEIRI
jgi:bifunctional non-homologous end joining protein LigD